MTAYPAGKWGRGVVSTAFPFLLFSARPATVLASSGPRPFALAQAASDGLLSQPWFLPAASAVVCILGFLAVIAWITKRTLARHAAQVEERVRERTSELTKNLEDGKKLAEALRASEEKFSIAFQSSPAIIAISTYPDGFYVDVNRCFTETLGYTPEELRGKRALDMGIWARPDQRAAIIGAIERGEQVRAVECVVRAKSGKLLTVLASVERVVISGKPCLLFINYDITDRRRNERILAGQKAILEQILAEKNIPEILDGLVRFIDAQSDGAIGSVLLLDPDGIHLRAGAAPGLPEVYNRAIDGVAIGPNVGSCGTSAWRKEPVIVSDIATDPLWERYKHLALPHGLAACASTPIMDNKGVVLGVFAFYYKEPRTPGPGDLALVEIACDLAAIALEKSASEAARKAAEAQLRQAQKMEAIGTLAGGIAHDFNNILGAVLGFSQLALIDAKGNAAVTTNIQEVMQAAKRARDLVRQILTFSRQQERERTVIELSLAAREAMTLLRAAVPSNIALRSEFDPNTPTVVADPSQIHQVVMNLVTNAAQAIGAKGGTIDLIIQGIEVDDSMVRTNPELRTGKHARISVKDDGGGMDAATLARIFDPFFTTKGPGEGTGLGLSVVHGIVQLHKGVIAVESAVGAGTTFHIYLPAHSEPAPSAAANAAGLVRGRGERVLVVDDEPGLARFLQQLLNRAGYQVDTYTTPEEALEAFRASPHSYHLLITDLTMPGMSGMQLGEAVAAIRPSMPMLLMTGYDATVTLDSVRRIGFADLMIKPMPAETLSQAIRKALSQGGI